MSNRTTTIGETASPGAQTTKFTLVDIFSDPDDMVNLAAFSPEYGRKRKWKQVHVHEAQALAEKWQRENLNVYVNVEWGLITEYDDGAWSSPLVPLRFVWATIASPIGFSFSKARYDTWRQAALVAIQALPEPVPTVIDTGLGFQLLWRLKEPADPWDGRKQANRIMCAMAKALGTEGPTDNKIVSFQMPGTKYFDYDYELEEAEFAVASIVQLASETATLEQLETVWESLAAEPTVEQLNLKKAFEDAENYVSDEPPPTVAPESPKVARPPGADTFALPLEQFASELQPVSWLVEGVIESDTTGLIFGEQASLKTFAMLGLGLSVGTGRDWHDHFCAQAPVLYILAEGRGGFSRRCRAWCLHHGVELAGVPFDRTQRAHAIGDADGIEVVRREIERLEEARGEPYKLIIIDPLAKTFGDGDENHAGSMTRYMNHADSLRAPHGRTILIVHHSGKSNRSQARGSSALMAAVDWAYRVDRKGDRVRLTNTKMKDGIPPKPLWFQLVDVPLEEIDSSSAVLVPIAPPVEKAEREYTENQQAVLSACDELLVELGEVTTQALRVRAKRHGVASKHVTRTLEQLVERGDLKVDETLVSRT